MKALLLALLLSLGVAQAGTLINIEEPSTGSTSQGVSNIRGWAVSSGEIETLKLYIDGEYISDVPYGSSRGDVGNAFKDSEYLDPELSGFSMTFYYGLLDPRVEYVFEVVAYDNNDEEMKSSSSNVWTVSFSEDEWHKVADTYFVQCYATEDRNGFILHDLWLSSTFYSWVVFKWSDATQGFAIVDMSKGYEFNLDGPNFIPLPNNPPPRGE